LLIGQCSGVLYGYIRGYHLMYSIRSSSGMVRGNL
jgi:hypothetical protein